MQERKILQNNKELELIFLNFKQSLSFKQSAVFTLDNKGMVSSWNKNAKNLIGYTKEEVLGKNFLRFYVSKKSSLALKLEEVKHLGQIAKETKMVRKDGSTFLANILIFPLKDNNKTVGFTHVVHNVSYIKDNEKALKKCAAELEKTKETLEIKNAKDEALLESIGEGVVATDNKGKMILINSTALSMFGLTADMSHGKLFTKVFCAYDEKGKKIPSRNLTVPVVLRTRKKVLHSRFYYGIIGKNNFPAEATSSPVILYSKTIGTITIFRNIKKEIEVDKVKKEFISIVSHQLRTPLTAIKLLTEMMFDSIGTNTLEGSKEILKNIQESNEKMIYLVNNLLKMSQMETGNFKIIPVSTEINKFILSVVKDAIPIAKTKNISLIFLVKDENFMIMKIDKELFRQVLLNLILNAIEYSKKGSKVWIDFSKEKDGSCVISVKDRGIGIPKDTNEKIFDRFFRATNAINYKPSGTGLGLYVCRLIVQKHGGHIWVKSSNKTGSVFYVSIPPKHKINHLD